VHEILARIVAHAAAPQAERGPMQMREVDVGQADVDRQSFMCRLLMATPWLRACSMALVLGER